MPASAKPAMRWRHVRAGLDQTDAVSALPAELADHVARLEMTPGGATIRAEGWDIAMVDLDRIVAFQPQRVDRHHRGPGCRPDPGDLRSIAGLTLPINDTAPVAVQYDALNRAYTITSPTRTSG